MGFGQAIVNLGGSGWKYVNQTLDNAAETTGNFANNVVHMHPVSAAGDLGHGAAQQVKIVGGLLQNSWRSIAGGD